MSIREAFAKYLFIDWFYCFIYRLYFVMMLMGGFYMEWDGTKFIRTILADTRINVEGRLSKNSGSKTNHRGFITQGREIH